MATSNATVGKKARTPARHYRDPGRWRVVLAFAAIYVIWGSTYLGIRFAVETIPPFPMAGTRFIMAGSILYALCWVRGARRPSLVHWRSALIVGSLMLLIANGLVTWAEQRIASGTAALLIATEPLWIVLFDWLRTRGKPPIRRVIVGLVMGLLGTFLLIGPADVVSGHHMDLLGAGAVVVAGASWALGSLCSSEVPLPPSRLQGTAMEMLVGGVLLCLVGLIAGQWGQLDWAAVTTRSWVSLLYLALFGSIIAFSSYIFLMRATTPARVSTYAYVNPVIAVLLGWAIAGESLTLRMMIAAAIIIAGVVLITDSRPTN